MGKRKIPLSVIEEYQNGMTTPALAKKYGVSVTGICDLFKRYDIECRGSRNFTDAEEAEIAKIYSVGGFSAKAIARAYGLNHHISICAALKRQGIKQRPRPERNRLYKLNPHVFDVIDNEQAAYWWGFLYADGCTSRRTLSVTIKVKDQGHIEKLRQFMESEAPIMEYIVTLNGYSKNYKQAGIQLTDRHLIARLRELGIVAGRPNTQKALSHLPDCLTNHWIRGYFDGDGSARKSPSIAFCGSRKLLIWLREQFAAGAGTNPQLAVTKHNKANIYYFYISGRLQALKAARYIYQDATIWMPRKREVIDNWPEPKERHRNGLGQWT